jgi:cobalamin synthase
MRDHAIGSYGATALVLLLLFKAACLFSLVRSQRGLLTIMLVPGLSRWSIVFLSRLLPYARMDETSSTGTGSLCQHVSRFDLIFATACCAIFPLLIGMLQTLACWAATILVSVCLATMCARRIGGITGDTLGANVVISEAAQYLVALLLSPR